MPRNKSLIWGILLLFSAGLCPSKTSAQIFAVRANALAALTATVDLGAEVSVADRWTVEASVCWNPIHTDRFSTNFYALQAGSRYWFYESFVGHFLGGQLTYVDYDLGSRRKRYDGRAYGIGFSYGYSWMLSKRWNIVLEAGIGLYRTKDTRRDPTVGDWEGEYIYHARRWTLAPSKLEVSFSYLF